ncbi:MAG: hypothetical protein Q4D38_06935 [Planctomycetia bacterium]|nr:hypothetical protein [Planctomycetia bacterium]
MTKTFTLATLVTLAAYAIFACSGCSQDAGNSPSSAGHVHDENCGHDHSDHDAHDAASEADAHAALHISHYKQWVVNFPGHKYALEVTTQDADNIVRAYLTNAHFEPIAAGVESVEIRCVVSDAPQSFTLAKVETAAGESLRFELASDELKALLRGESLNASAVVEIDGAPFSADFEKAK